MGRGRQGRGDPPDHSRARRAGHPGDPDRRTNGRGEGAPLPVAVLAPPLPGRPLHDLRPELVRPRPGGTRGGLRHGPGVAARLRGDQHVRAAARGARHHAGEVLAPHLPGGAGAPLPGPRRDSLQALEAHRRGLAEPREAKPLRGGRERHVERTSTQSAPWILVEGEDKRYARIKVLQSVCESLERALG